MITVDFKRLNIQPGDRILDVGCGTGRHTCAAYRLEKVSVIGTDLDLADLLKSAEGLKLHDRLGEHGSGFWGLAVADTMTLPFRDCTFKVVICSEVLEHLYDYHTGIAEAVRVLQRDGFLVVSVPRRWPERICWALSGEYAQAEGGHVRIFKKNLLKTCIEQAGVEMIWSHHAHSLHSPYWWLKCLVGPSRNDNRLVNIYHRFLTWDIMKKPRSLQLIDELLNPILGKSLVMYFRKG